MEPTYIDKHGNKYWRVDGYLHRVDGPAVESVTGTKMWYLNGKLHRIDGPAHDASDGTKFWFLNGKLHRIDGTAIKYAHADADEHWYLDHERYSFEEWKVEVRKYYDTEEDYLLLLLKL
jgi:hypothetical protein